MHEAEDVLAVAALAFHVRRDKDGDSGAGARVRARGVRVRLGEVDGLPWSAAGVRDRGGDEDEMT